jgi:hypothetical protein
MAIQKGPSGALGTSIEAGEIATGAVSLDKLSATGTKDATTFLRGDNSFAVVAVTPTAVSSQANTATDYFSLPVGTTAQRPGSPASGMVRMNSTTGEPEWYDSARSAWTRFSESDAYFVDYLVVAGGGNGGSGNGGAGGGGGGVLNGKLLLTESTAYTVTIGAGGAGSNLYAQNNGSNSVFGSLTAIGGGAGGSNASGTQNGLSGGSGGGGGGDGSITGEFSVAGAGTDGQGNRGGRGWIEGGNNTGGGGGGAGQMGTHGEATNTRAGDGGAGFLTDISGAMRAYAGGGGGASQSTNRHGYGATGCGGDGGDGGANGVVNRGGGGGGAKTASGANSGSGGSGVIIIRYAGAQRGTGGTVTSAGGFTIHTFTSSGTYTA